MSLARGHQYSADDEAFFRAMVFLEEERSRFTAAEWDGSFRWFSSPNVVCFEKYQRTRTLTAPHRPGVVVRLELFRRTPPRR